MIGEIIMGIGAASMLLGSSLKAYGESKKKDDDDDDDDEDDDDD